MKIERLKIENFKAIRSIELTDLQDTVVVAGPNGSGKSCIFDAIRLTKSVYVGYHQNEWQQWFSEFQINVNRLRSDVTTLLQDRNAPLIVEIDFSFSSDEIKFVSENCLNLIEAFIWERMFPDDPSRRMHRVPASDFQRLEPQISQDAESRLAVVKEQLAQHVQQTLVLIKPDGELRIKPSQLVELIFSTYDPTNLGLIDFHGASRQYARESIGGISFNVDEVDQRYKNHILYGYAEKYKNIKSELASAFIKDLISAQAGEKNSTNNSLTTTLKELFTLFFPGKRFAGPQAYSDGKLGFPVVLEDGATHDINDLSSGEKEVLYGYLRLQNTSPRNSIVLLDEPELHLNPRLVKGLPRFYQKHIGRAKNNQIWLATHSDAFLRSSVGEPGFSVYHLRSPLEVRRTGLQLKLVSADDEVEAVIYDLVGDLAAYSPGKKIVIFEGGGDSDFDVRFVSDLFPGLLRDANLVSGESKGNTSAC